VREDQIVQCLGRDRSLSVAAQALHDLVLAHRPTPATAPKALPRAPQPGRRLRA